MYHVIGTQKQYQEFIGVSGAILPDIVHQALTNALKILDDCYGADRDIDRDMGGYCIIFPPGSPLDTQEYNTILSRYHLRSGEWEYREKIQDKNTFDTWIEELYLVDNDYGILFFYPISERTVKI